MTTHPEPPPEPGDRPDPRILEQRVIEMYNRHRAPHEPAWDELDPDNRAVRLSVVDAMLHTPGMRYGLPLDLTATLRPPPPGLLWARHLPVGRHWHLTRDTAGDGWRAALCGVRATEVTPRAPEGSVTVPWPAEVCEACTFIHAADTLAELAADNDRRRAIATVADAPEDNADA